MYDYNALRSSWIARLDAAGELSRLDAERRAVLERGSLEVLRTAQIEQLDRRRRRRAATAATAAASLLALALLAVLSPDAWLDTASTWSLGTLPLIAAAAFMVGLVQARAAVLANRRRLVYQTLDESGDALAHLRG